MEMVFKAKRGGEINKRLTLDREGAQTLRSEVPQHFKVRKIPLTFNQSIHGTSLAVQWLRLQASNAGGVRVRSLVGELRAHMLHGMARKKRYPSTSSFLQPSVSAHSPVPFSSSFYQANLLLTFPFYYFLPQKPRTASPSPSGKLPLPFLPGPLHPHPFPRAFPCS